ncbi:MAG TPA: ATP-binding protein, partial [Ignavibacteriaceae bacterium]|nr:ATP-binding protein [Ignavibacteriaceae bacterium]
MLKNFQILEGDRKYFAIVFFILLLILISGILTPVYIEYTENNWSEKLTEQIQDIESSVNSILKQKGDDLQLVSSTLRQKLKSTLNSRNSSYSSLINLVNDETYNDYSLEIIAPNGRMIAWNKSIAINQEDIFPLSYPPGQTHFYTGDLITYLSITDTVHLESDLFYYIISLPFEKNYSLQNSYYQELNFAQELSEQFLTRFEVNYNPFTPKSSDGRKYSFDLLNNKGNKIGSVSFIKPGLDIYINSIQLKTNEIQSVLLALALFFIAFGFKKEYKSVRFRSVRLLIFIFYCTLFRSVIFIVGFPSNFLQGPLVDAANFSSAFSWGIVKSPIELIISALFVLIISIRTYLYVIDFIKDPASVKYKNYWFFGGLFVPASLMFFTTFRGLFASMKSIIFDSTLRYFQEAILIPDFIFLVMNFAILMIGLAIILFLLTYFLLLFYTVPEEDEKKRRMIFILTFICFEGAGFLFIYLQLEPLINYMLSFIFVLLVFLVLYYILFRRLDSLYNFIYATLAASVITITLLNFFNLQLEKESLKTSALEINRPDDNLLRFLINETLNGALKNDEIINSFYRLNTNYNSIAFIIWSGSSLQRESINSAVMIYDKDMKEVGRFSIGIRRDFTLPRELMNYSGNSAMITEAASDGNSSEKIFVGIIPVKERGIVSGYIAAVLNFTLQNWGARNIPDFLESKKNIINSVLDVRQLKIFEFKNSGLVQVYGDIYPSRDQYRPIINANFTSDNEAWLTINLNSENYLTYALRTNEDDSRIITSVSLVEKHITWNLFNFFKIFLVHSIFILILFIIFFVINYKEFRYSFRTQLLIAFLIISIIPVIILAIYNRQVVADRSQSVIFNELNERSDYLINHVRSQMETNRQNSVEQAFENAGRELRIAFSVYNNTNLIYSSRNQYYTAGLFAKKLDSDVYYHLNYLSYREYLTEEKIEDYAYDAFYKKISINGMDIIIGVNDAFNKVHPGFSPIDIDVFLFGIYSFAAIIIIIISTILANKISSPVRRLTKATDSVAHGDLNVQLALNERGEIRDLMEGFNAMTQELKRNEIEMAELERENAWKEMAKQVAHEIKNPLTPMKLAVQQLIISYRDKNKNFDSIFEKVSKTVLNQIDNLNIIASEFSRFARMPNFKLEVMDIIPVIRDTMNLFVEEDVNMMFVSELKEAVAETDRFQVRRLFINMIRNSIQAESESINISLKKEEEFFILTIDDNGKGIDEQHREKIFEPGYTTKEKGMGIGLKLSKRFV